MHKNKTTDISTFLTKIISSFYFIFHYIKQMNEDLHRAHILLILINYTSYQIEYFYQKLNDTYCLVPDKNLLLNIFLFLP